MGIKDCKITLDNHHNAYYPGQTLNGYVEFTFDSVKKVRGIYVKFKGEAETYWSETERRNNADGKSQTYTTRYSGKEQYFTTEFYLIGKKNGSEIEIPAGTHRYPITCALPPTLPTSFEGEFGYVRYTIKVTLDRPWKFDQETKMAFTIVSHLDLNLDSKYKAPLSIHMTKKFCCWCCKSAPVKLDVYLPMSGYCPGQTIPLDVSCENGSGVDINQIIIQLKKVCTYHSETPRSHIKKNSVTLSDVKLGGVPANTTRNLSKSIQIPPLPPSNLDNCGIIDLKYHIFAVLSPSGMHNNKEVSQPITIGTVPVVDFQASQPANMIANPAANIEAPFLATAPPETPDVEKSQPYYPSSDNPPYPAGNLPYPPVHPPYPSSNMGYPDMAPPTYQESQLSTASIQDGGDGPHVMFQGNSQFAPKYPTYGFYLPPSK